MSTFLNNLGDKFRRNPRLKEGVLGSHATKSAVVRTKEEIADYRQWRSSSHCFRTGMWLRDQYDVHQRQPFCTDEGVDFINTSNSKSFRIHPALTKFSDKSMLHFAQLIAEKMEQFGYVMTLNDKCKFNGPYWIETLQRQHFQSVSASEDPILRGFQEIQIRLMFKGSGFCFLEMEAITSDMPHASVDFSALLDLLID
jgi:hypothetical protein